MRNFIRKYGVLFPGAVAFSIPFGIHPMLYFIGLWIVAVLIQGGWQIRWKENMNSRSKKWLIYLFIYFYVLHLINLWHAPDIVSGLREMEIKISFVLLPVLFVVSERWTLEKQRTVLRFFVAGVLLAVIVCYGHAFMNSVHFVQGKVRFMPHPDKRPWANYFLYFDYSFLLHPSYFAMYISFATVLILESFHEENPLVPGKKILLILLLLFFFMTIVLLSSRAGFFSFALVIILYYMKIIKERSGKKEKVLVLAGLLLVVVLFIYVFFQGERTRLMIRQISSVEKWDHDPHDPGSIAIRFILWQDAWEIIQQHPWRGTGTGSTRKVLYDGKNEGRYLWPAKKQLNVHNQFLETWMEEGIFGLLILLSLVSFPYYQKNSPLQNVFVILTVILIINFLFESMLARVNGVVFFVFFYSLMGFGAPRDTRRLGQKMPDSSSTLQNK